MRRWSRIAAMVLAGLAVGIGAVAAGASTTTPSGSYKGKTKKGMIVSFKVKSGKIHNFSATVDAFCISALAPGSSHFDTIFHFITPPPMKLSSSGKFSADYKLKPSSTHATVDGKISGKNASGHYSLTYSTIGGFTSLGTAILFSCSDKGTWRATRK